MTAGSKRQARLARQAAKLGEGDTKIPAQVTNMPDGLREHIGDDKFRLVFEYYDHSQCEMVSLDKDSMKRLFNTFAKITKYDQTNISKLCRPDPVKRKGATGDYKKLFNNLPDDFDVLMEVDYKGSGRIFTYLYKDMCCVVAIKGVHL